MSSLPSPLKSPTPQTSLRKLPTFCMANSTGPSASTAGRNAKTARQEPARILFHMIETPIQRPDSSGAAFPTRCRLSLLPGGRATVSTVCQTRPRQEPSVVLQYCGAPGGSPGFNRLGPQSLVGCVTSLEIWPRKVLDPRDMAQRQVTAAIETQLLPTLQARQTLERSLIFRILRPCKEPRYPQVLQAPGQVCETNRRQVPRPRAASSITNNTARMLNYMKRRRPRAFAMALPPGNLPHQGPHRCRCDAASQWDYSLPTSKCGPASGGEAALSLAASWLSSTTAVRRSRSKMSRMRSSARACCFRK